MIAIIPARGGSKGLRKKNIARLFGKPLIAWTIETLLKAKNIQEIIISTDDDEIASVCKKYDVNIPFMRPPRLSQDTSLAIDVYKYTINRLNKDFGYNINDFLISLPTTPLKNSSDIDNAIDIFYTNKVDSVISCAAISHPLNWIISVDENKKITKLNNHLPVKKMMNRQENVSQYLPNGAIYILKLENIIKYNSYYTNNSLAYTMPRNRSVDIDTIDDLTYAEYLLQKKN